ncbi:MAG TPA: DapH/DapD/GlmU-related protein [Burkholderiales bacterium]
MRDLIIYGASFLDCVKLVDAANRARPTWRIRGFLDDTLALQGKTLLGHRVLGGKERLAELAADPQADLFNNVRGGWQRCQLIAQRLREAGRDSVSLIHPAIDLAYVEHGPGCALSEGCVVAAMTRLGAYVTARVGCTISHDTTLEDYVLLGPGATIGSHVRIGARTLIGAGATVVTGITIGPGAIVAAGSLVSKDIEAGSHVAGVPARTVRSIGG